MFLRGLFIVIIMMTRCFAEEEWNQDQLEAFVAAHTMDQSHDWQVTAWGTWNDDNLDIAVMVEDLGDQLRYTITFPDSFVDSWYFVGGRSLWEGHGEWISHEPALRFQTAVPYQCEPPGPGPHVFTFPKAHRNRTFLTFVGMVNGKVRNGRIWLCGFTGLTAIASLPRYTVFPGTSPSM